MWGAGPSTRLDEIGAALEDGLGFVSRHLVLPTLGAFHDVLGGLFGISLRPRCVERDPGILAVLAQPNCYGEPAVGFDLGDAHLAGWRGHRLAHVVELDVANSAHDSIDAGTL